MASEKIFRSAVFGGFNRSDVISYIEDLRNEISDLQRKYADKETKINELEDKVGDLTAKCASLNDLQEKYNVQCDTVEALKNENPTPRTMPTSKTAIILFHLLRQ